MQVKRQIIRASFSRVRVHTEHIFSHRSNTHQKTKVIVYIYIMVYEKEEQVGYIYKYIYNHLFSSALYIIVRLGIKNKK
jgi:hypothetical protein